MGCINSKAVVEHPNVFRVVNIDDEGTELW